ncbi:hypothetical protein [Streptomyces sp. NRRL S-350]|uniref:hypothetical protein n=1 Tax=Streptomyces sp. NRRL S-350 TaxID=1463902 RepID=UPI0004BEC941|nr:hypothetical protein [Streptomyces sp. NRRL S-350]
MSTKAERAALTELLVEEWHDYAEILRERGETWDTINYREWSDGMYITSARVNVLLKAAKIIGLRIDYAAIDRLYRAQRDARARARRDELLADQSGS